jgi:hypothetical protein
MPSMKQGCRKILLILGAEPVEHREGAIGESTPETSQPAEIGR